MSLTVQNLRAVGAGVEPNSLLPGQIAFNVTDKILYVGDESAFKTNFDGSQVAGTPGAGWYSMPMDFDSLGEYYVANPAFYGDIPTDQQVLTWSDALNHPIWTSNIGGDNQVYVITNNDVAIAPGATTSAKITAAIGVVSPDEGDVTIVTGLPDDVYEGLYFFTTEWVKGAAYAYPSASEVIYNNVAHPTLGATVQFAIDDLDDGLIATTAIANTANSTANSALSIASAALPRAGGTMTGPLRLNSTLVDGAGSPGTVDQVLISTATGVQWVSNAPGDVTGVTGTAPITVDNTDPQNPVVGVSNATTSSTGVVQVGTNIDVASGVISVKTADASNLGLVEVGTNIDVASGVISVKTADTANLGLVEVGTNIDVASGVISVKTATNTDLGLVQSGANIQNTAGVISILNANTTQSGVVQLNDTTISTSTTEAATANAVRVTKDVADAAVPRASYAAGGDILVGTGAGTFGPLGVGNQGQILVVGPGNTVQWEDDAPGDVTGVTGTAPITVNNADPENPVVGVDLATTATPGVVQIELTGNINIVGGVINVPDASTTVKGAVQLYNSTTGGTDSLALTAAAGASLQSQIDALLLSNSVTLAGGYDATTGLVDGVTSQGTLAGFADGVAPPVASATNVDHYLICIVAGNNPSAMENGDWLLSVETSPGVYAYQVLGVGARPASASYTTAGIVQLADAAAVLAGTSDTTAITPQALQDNVIDSVTTANSSLIASATAVKTAYDAGVQGQTDAAAAQVTANAALPKAGGTMTGTITTQNVNVQSTYSLQFAGGVSGSLNAVTDLTNVTSSTTAASATAVKSAYDLANTANTTANAALPLAGGTMTGNITFQDAGEGVAFNGGSFIRGISDATGNTNNDIAASSTAVKDAYALAAAAVPKACYTALGALAAGTGASTVGTLALGTNGQFLAANTGCSTGLEWCNLSLACIPCSAFTASGQLLAGTGTSTFTALGVGTNGQFLVADSACTGGLKWLTAQGALLCGYTCTATPFNTVLGSLAGAALTGLSVANTAIGYAALDSETSGDFNTAVGHNALTAQNGSTGNTAVGGNAGAQVTTGSANTLMGYNAGDALTNGAQNTAIGVNSLGTNLSGTSNVAVGSSSLQSSTGSQNTAVGNGAGCAVTIGTGHVYIGYLAGSNSTSSCNNTFVGWNSGGATTGACNTFIGNNSGSAVTTGSCNTLVGRYTGTAGLANNVVLSDGAGTIRFQSNASGAWSPNGTNFGTIGQFLTSQGTVAAPTWCTLSLACVPCAAFTAVGDILVGTGSATFTALPTGIDGQSLVVDTTCTATGGLKWVTPSSLCGYTCTVTPFNTALGANALAAATSGAGNVAIGLNAGAAVTTGGCNTHVGFGAGCLSTVGFNTFVGHGAGDATVTSACSVAIGYNALGAAATALGSTAVGTCALLQLTTGACNTVVGFQAGDSLTTGGSNTVLGYGALSAANSSAGSTALGANALNVASGAGNTAIGSGAGSSITSGANNTLVGRYTGTAAMSNNVVLSDGAGNIKLQVNQNGAVGVGTTPSYGTAGQTLQSNGTAAVPTWVTPQTISTTATKAVTSATPVNLLSWDSGVSMGDLIVMATDNSANVVWANVTIASSSGIGSSVVVTQAGTFGTFAVIAGGSGETIVEFTPSSTLATVDFVYKYTVSFGTQPTVL